MFEFIENLLTGNIRFSYNNDDSNKKDCYKCIHRRDVPQDCHSSCANKTCKVTCIKHGFDQGWFFFPENYDPAWLTSCDGFEEKRNKE